jgi:hypothetical protein
MQNSQQSAAITSKPEPVELWPWPFAVGLAAFLVAIYASKFFLNDPDTFWHVGVGRWIIDHRAIPFHDPFSYTFQGQLWVPHEWLSEVIFAAIYQRFGWGGICAITALSFSAALILLTRRLQDWLEAPRPAIAAALAGILSAPHLLARPHVLALPLIVLWISGLISAREAKRAPSLALLPLMILWCNLHGGFIIGLIFCVLFALEAVFAADGQYRWQVLRQWGFFTICAFASALISPNGIQGVLFSVRMMQMTNALTFVQEWRSPDFHQFQPLELWIGLVILGGFCMGIRLPVMRILMVLLLLHEALASVRNVDLLGFIAPLLVAGPLATQLPASSPTVDRRLHSPIGNSAFGTVWGGVMLLVMTLMFCSTAWLLNLRGIRPVEKIALASALEFAHTNGLTGRVFNFYDFGGYLIFEGIPTFIDGRADPYTDQFIGNTFAAVNGSDKKLNDLLDQYGVEWTLLPPYTAATMMLDHLPNWRRVYSDAYAVIHRREL